MTTKHRAGRRTATTIAATTAATVAGLALLVATTASADARPVYHDDQTHDVLKYDDSAQEPVGAPDQVNGDIVRTHLWHAHRVGAQVRFADLQKTGDFRADVLRIHTNENVNRTVMISAGPGNWRGSVDLTKANGDTVPCRVAHSIDYTANVVTVRVPRSCLSRPRWVSMGFGSLTSDGDDTGTMYLDDALAPGVADELTLSRHIWH
jgi:hypothetical protein